MNAIKELRKSKGWSQEKLASIIGVSRSTVSMWEIGASEPDNDMLRNLSSLLSASVDYILGTEAENKLKGVKIPVYGRVRAGIPIEAIEEILEWEEIPRAMALSGEYFGLQVIGDSMEPLLFAGDVVIVRKQEDAENGETVIALINGDDATVKKLIKQEDGIVLMPLNHKYSPMFFSNKQMEELPVCVLGKVVESRRKF